MRRPGNKGKGLRQGEEEGPNKIKKEIPISCGKRKLPSQGRKRAEREREIHSEEEEAGGWKEMTEPTG